MSYGLLFSGPFLRLRVKLSHWWNNFLKNKSFYELKFWILICLPIFSYSLAQVGFVLKVGLITRYGKPSQSSNYFKGQANRVHFKPQLQPFVFKQHIFELGGKFRDHVMFFSPFCIDQAKRTVYEFNGSISCSGFNRSDKFFSSNCPNIRNSALLEQAFSYRLEDMKWSHDLSKKIEWVEGLTLFQSLEPACSNVAHFASRTLLIHHLLENIKVYSQGGWKKTNVVILSSSNVYDRFLKPSKYQYYHKQFLEAVVAPRRLELSSFSKFIIDINKQKGKNHFSPAYILNNSQYEKLGRYKQITCFRQALLPLFLKGRFFVSDKEYIQSSNDVQFRAYETADSPNLPKDSLRFREKVISILNHRRAKLLRKKQVIFIDRDGSKRDFSYDSKKELIDSLGFVAQSKGFTFKIVNFSNISFSDQHSVMHTASIAIGIHGANLVNAMFEPPFSVLIEIFPYGFSHEMYIEGGNAGLKYYSYNMKNGTEFYDLKRYHSIKECIRRSKHCKVHYRDSKLVASPYDISNLNEILRKSIKWYSQFRRKASSRMVPEKIGLDG